ncbi:hypothetical protein [Metabacillus fastidiosus]|nr:hypothetical protein [Metabacillus fastidiosus]
MQIRRLIETYIQESNGEIDMKDLLNKIALVWEKTRQTKQDSNK